MRTRQRKINPGRSLKLRLQPKCLMRLLTKVKVCPDTGCWEWTGHRDPNGYGQIKVDGRAMWCNRVSYAVFRGSIQAGQEIDHKCNNTSCINPFHLQRKTPLANATDGGTYRHRNTRTDIPF